MTGETEYRIAIEPVAERVRVNIGGIEAADSRGALVMHETHLPSHPYFPKAEVKAGLLEPSALRTFCPFKGTAHYWNLRLPGGIIENGAWSYEMPLEESAAVAGYVAFDPKHVDTFSSDGPLPATSDKPMGSSPLIDWVMRKAWLCETPAALTEQFAEQLAAIGMPLWRLNITIWTLHPVLAGRRFTWKRGEGMSEGETPKGVLQHPAYLNSPVRHVSEGLGGVRQRLDDDDPEFQFPIMADLRATGGTDYVAMPLFFSNGQIHTMTLASDDPEGFSTAQLGQVFGSLTALGRFFEVLILRHNTNTLFDTYLGERTRRQVLGGSTQRGDGENIRAAIILCDLRHSTSMAGSLPRETYLGLLNDFFEQTTEPVASRGGEVLKFIGDAVLAIFPVEESDGEEGEEEKIRLACATALEAAADIVHRVSQIATGDGVAPLRCAIGLHIGDVMYGNVGAPRRLDFTVTGTAVNVAARLSEQCKMLEQQLLLSADVAHHVPGNLTSLGTPAMRHVDRDLEVYGLEPLRGTA